MKCSKCGDEVAGDKYLDHLVDLHPDISAKLEEMVNSVMEEMSRKDVGELEKIINDKYSGIMRILEDDKSKQQTIRLLLMEILAAQKVKSVKEFMDYVKETEDI